MLFSKNLGIILSKHGLQNLAQDYGIFTK
ncbi:hypothetical protein MXB_3838 [Myxobolus squamalis]|nr:hypothetical protein MXB_3838 [Myxobolus squamalis]